MKPVHWGKTVRPIHDKYTGFQHHLFFKGTCFRITRAIEGIEEPSVRDVGDGIIKYVESYPNAAHFLSGREEGNHHMHFTLLDNKGNPLHTFKVRGPTSKGHTVDPLLVYDPKDPKLELKPVMVDRKTGKVVEKK